MLTEKKAANLKDVAARVGLAPCSVSAILNNTEAARAIPQATKDRVYRAATELNYRPNYWARSLRTRHTRMVAVLAADLDRSAAQVVVAAQRRLHELGYLLVLISSDTDDVVRLSAHLQQRGIEGVIAVNASVAGQLSLPVVSVDFGCRISPSPAVEDMDGWLLELGETAARAMVQQIESPGTPQRTRVSAKMPAAFFDPLTAHPEFAVRAESA